MRIEKVVRALRPIQQITITVGGHPHIASDPSATLPETSSPPRARDALNWHNSGRKSRETRGQLPATEEEQWGWSK